MQKRRWPLVAATADFDSGLNGRSGLGSDATTRESKPL